MNNSRASNQRPLPFQFPEDELKTGPNSQYTGPNSQYPRRNTDRWRRKDSSHFTTSRHRNDRGHATSDRHAGPVPNRSCASRNQHRSRNQVGYRLDADFDGGSNHNYGNQERFYRGGNESHRSNFGSSRVDFDERYADGRQNVVPHDRLEHGQGRSRNDSLPGSSYVNRAEPSAAGYRHSSNAFVEDR